MLCCQCVKPRYKRLVDNIYPKDPSEGLVHSNMSKLQYYALQSSPNKLDKIGQYLLGKVERDLHRRDREMYIFISMDALDQLLNACHSRALNLFVTSFLSIIEILLEKGSVPLKSRATKSFIQFCNIQEESPTHQRYCFFIEMFATLSHTDPKNVDHKPIEGRVAGLQGLQGIVRKTADEDVARFQLFDKGNLSKILPALLMNIEKGEWEAQHANSRQLQKDSARNDEEFEADMGGVGHVGGGGSSVHQRESSVGGDEKSRLFDESDSASDTTPQLLAERCFRDLFQRVKFGTTHLSLIFYPMLNYLDTNGWENSRFVAKCITLVMTSISPQYAFDAITLWLNHISERKTEVIPKIEIVQHLKDSLNIAASQTFGTSIYEVIDKLVQYLKMSIECELRFKKESRKLSEQKEDRIVPVSAANHHKSESLNATVKVERQYQEALIEVMGSITVNVADYQKLEIIKFLFEKCPGRPSLQGANAANANGASISAVTAPGTPYRHQSKGGATNTGGGTTGNTAGGTMNSTFSLDDSVYLSLDETDKRMQNYLLKCIESVALLYTTVNYSDTFKAGIITPLIQLSVSPDANVRILVLGIIQRLLDRHENREKLARMDLLPDLENIRTKGFKSPTSRSDQNFMCGTGQSFFHTIYVNCFFESNTRESFDAIYCTLALLIIEVGFDESCLLEMFKLLLAIQEEIRDRTDSAKGKEADPAGGQVSFVVDASQVKGQLTEAQLMTLNAFVACTFNLIGKLFSFSYKHLDEYITGVLFRMSQLNKPRMDPQTAAKLQSAVRKSEVKSDVKGSKSSLNDCLFHENALETSLNKDGFAANFTKFVPKNKTDLLRRNSMDAGGLSMGNTHRSSIGEVNFDLDSEQGSLSSLQLRSNPYGPNDSDVIDIQKIKLILSEGLSREEREEEERRKRALKEDFATLPMRELAETIAKENREAHSKRKQILDKIDTYSQQRRLTNFPLDPVDKTVHFNTAGTQNNNDLVDNNRGRGTLSSSLDEHEDIQFPQGFLI